MPVILATQQEIRRITVQSQPREIVARPYLAKPFMKIELLEWFKVKILSSIPSTTKKNKIKSSKPGTVAHICNTSY
jgi:hypothetical protein